MITISMIEPFRAKTLSDLIVRLLYISIGLHTGFRKNFPLQIVTSVFWLLVHITGLMSLLVIWQNSLWEPGSKGLSLFALIGSECAHIGAVICFSILIIRDHDEIEKLIRRSGRKPEHLLLQIACMMPFSLIDFRRALSAANTEGSRLVDEVYFALLHFSVMVFFLTSSDVLHNLKDAHHKLVALTANVEVNEEEIRCLKWELRDRIKRINKIFAWTWGVHYALILNTGVFVAVAVIDRSLAFTDKTVVFIGHICVLLRLLDLAESSSSLKENCLDIEGRLLGRGRGNAIESSASEALVATMAYREDLDILRNGCFPLETRRFFSFLATSVTCTAVILQFDYHVLQSLAQASASAQNW